jgi:hypothetical protein
MSVERLKYLSEHRLLELKSNISANLERYVRGDFRDLAAQNGWAVEHALTVDLSPLEELDPAAGAEVEVTNSLLVWKALHGLSPALATEERIWVRLAHLNCLEFCRKRWLRAQDQDSLIREIGAHLFAATQTAIRDDNGVSRLWWNAYIARLAMPDDPEKALRTILKKADFRSNFVERTRTVSRSALAAGIIRAMLSESWVTESESNFRSFMKAVNKFGGGLLFEVMESDSVDNFILNCIGHALDESMESKPSSKNVASEEIRPT